MIIIIRLINEDILVLFVRKLVDLISIYKDDHRVPYNH